MVVIFPMLAKMLAGPVINELMKLEEGGPVNKTQMALVHKGEFMLPKGVKPTPAQRRAVAKKKLTKAKAKVNKPQIRKPIGKPAVRKPAGKKRKGKK